VTAPAPPPARVVVTGATGFIGRALTLRLLGEGWSVTALARSPASARSVLAGDVDVVDWGDNVAVQRAIDAADAIVHLAGESVAGGRWSSRRKAALVASRVALTEQLGALIAARPAPLPALVSASAIGFYGDRADELLDEDAAPGRGFLAQLCVDWEASARRARGHVGRLAIARIGVVLGRDGGALAKLAPLARRRLAGRIGDGAQWVSWIHVHDVVAALARLAADARASGVYNLVAPHPVPQRELAAALGAHSGRPAQIPVPTPMLKLVMGEASSMLLASQRVTPARLADLGFAFTHPELDGALAASVGDDDVELGRAPAGRGTDDDSAYLRSRPARYQLAARTVLDAPLEQVFPFFARAENLSAITPSSMSFRIMSPTPIAMQAGAVIDYRIRTGPVPMAWRTLIEAWEPGRRFVDSQTHGPYKAWWHEHRFVADGDRTVMEDRVLYAPPLGPLGWIANRLIVAPMLRRIFAYRTQAILARFPARPPASTAGAGATELDARVRVAR
jgi:uncharacterized protein (TIGR01777 family)